MCEGICLFCWSSLMVCFDLFFFLLGEILIFVFVCWGGGIVCVFFLIGCFIYFYIYWGDIDLCEGMCKFCWGGLMVVLGLLYFYWKDIDFCVCVCVGRGMIVVLDWFLFIGEILFCVWGICRLVICFF